MTCWQMRGDDFIPSHIETQENSYPLKRIRERKSQRRADKVDKSWGSRVVVSSFCARATPDEELSYTRLFLVAVASARDRRIWTFLSSGVLGPLRSAVCLPLPLRLR